jgi:hypothetical protein
MLPLGCLCLGGEWGYLLPGAYRLYAQGKTGFYQVRVSNKLLAGYSPDFTP